MAIDWPEKSGEPAEFSEIVEPVVKAIRFAYRLKRQNKDKDVPWDGLPIGAWGRATCLHNHEALTKDNLNYDEHEQGRDPLQTIIGIAVRLGIEQGHRIFKSSTEYHLLKLRDFAPGARRTDGD